MGPAGRARLGPGDEFAATIDAQGPDPTRSDAAAEAAGELVERLTDGGGQLIAIAPHGGDIEAGTDDEAEQMRSQLAAEHAVSPPCRGWRPGSGAVRRWHITSADLAPERFPQLHTVIGRGFTPAVAFHGSGGSDVLLGGGVASATLQQAITESIRQATGLPVHLHRHAGRSTGPQRSAQRRQPAHRRRSQWGTDRTALRRPPRPRPSHREGRSRRLPRRVAHSPVVGQRRTPPHRPPITDEQWSRQREACG